jgi:hypothetical protein
MPYGLRRGGAPANSITLAAISSSANKASNAS